MDLIDYGGEKVPATYLGDAVYAVYNSHDYILRLNDHRNVEGEIFLEPSVMENFDNFRKECQLWVKRVEDEREESENLA